MTIAPMDINLTSTMWLNDSDDALSETKSNNSDTSTEHNGYSAAQAVLDFLNLYYLCALIIVGVLGNGRNVYLFVRSNNKKELTSPSYYLAALALADVVFLVTLFILWLGHFVGAYLLAKPGIRHFLFYLSSVSSCISAWLIVAFTFERLIVVRYPLKRSKLCTIRRAKIIIGCLIIAAFIVQIIVLFPTDAVDERARAVNNSTESSSSSRKVLRFFSMFETAVTLVVVPVLIVIMNALIIRGLFKFNKTFKKGEMNKHLSSSTKKTRRSNESTTNADAIAVTSQSEDIQLNMDAIIAEADVVHRSPSQESGDRHLQQDEDHATSLIANRDADNQTQQQRRNEKKVEDRQISNNRTEYAITKKLVLISTVHICLNLPSYVGNMKTFIHETIGSIGNDIEMILSTWYFDQFAMVLYYTSFSIHFLLYPSNNSNRNLNIGRFLVGCCCRKKLPVM